MKSSEVEGSQNDETVLQREQQFILDSLQNDDYDSLPESTHSSQEAGYISCDEIEDDLTTSSTDSRQSRCLSVLSNDGGYISSDEDRSSKHNVVVLDIDLSPVKISSDQILLTIKHGTHDNLPTDLQFLVEALNYGIPDAYEVPIDDTPPWFDCEKFKLGQKFAVKYYFGLNYCEMLSLLLLFTSPNSLDTLIYSRNSSTPFTAYKRYLSTVLRVKSWFEDDIWDKNSTGFKNLRAVRAMHLNISKKINSDSEEGLNAKLRKEDALWCPLNDDLREDFRSICPAFHCSPDRFRSRTIYVNQCEMSLTQFGFFGLMILFPGKFGAGDASKEELDAFIHVWRVLGYYLGIEDRFNFCQGSMEEIKSRCKHVIDYWFKPNFSRVSQEWEHMSRCLTEGVSYYVSGVSFEVSLSYLCWVLGVDTPKLHTSLTWRQYLLLILMKLTMCVVLRIPGVLSIYNALLRRSLNRAQNRTPEILKRLENKVYTFKTPNCQNTKL